MEQELGLPLCLLGFLDSCGVAILSRERGLVPEETSTVAAASYVVVLGPHSTTCLAYHFSWWLECRL